MGLYSSWGCIVLKSFSDWGCITFEWGEVLFKSGVAFTPIRNMSYLYEHVKGCCALYMETLVQIQSDLEEESRRKTKLLRLLMNIK